jgi:hypothetical protein
MLMGAVVAVMTAMLLLLNFLDNPYHPGVGSLKPVAMERTLRILDEALPRVNVQVDAPCDEKGRPS